MRNQSARRRVRSMRSLICFLIYCLSMDFSFANSKNSPLLSVKLKGHYGSQNTIVTKENSDWICKTELTPYHLSRIQPFSVSILKQLRSLPKQTPDIKSCRDKILIIDHTQKKVSEYIGCANTPLFSSFISELNKNCGRN